MGLHFLNRLLHSPCLMIIMTTMKEVIRNHVLGRLRPVLALVLALTVLPCSSAVAGETIMKEQVAIFAGGCFWCMEPPYDKLEGVKETISGYTGGDVVDPTYAQVSSGKTGHTEAVKIVFDPDVITYRELLDVFWKNIDPTAVDRQFVDIGRQYRTAVFYLNEEQRRIAQESMRELEASGRFDRPLATQILPAGPFYPAEEYHQDYYLKNPLRYKFYRLGSGRDAFLERVWGEEKSGE